MNKSSFMLFAMAGAMTLASCSNEEVNGNDTKNAQLQVVANIALPQTRAFDDQWNAGDQIGIYTLKAGTTDIDAADNLAYRNTLTEGSAANANFVPAGNAAKLPDDGSKVDVVAYYPYSASAAAGVVELDVQKQDNQAAVDLLGAKAEGVSADAPQAVLNFKHKLTKIFIRTTAEDGSSLSDLKAYIKGMYTKVSYSAFADELSMVSGDTKKDVEMRSADGYYVEAIVLPNIAGNDATTRNIEFEHNGKVYKAAISADVKFESGKKYVYNATFTATGVKIEGAGITNWEDVTGDDVVVVPGGEAQYHYNNIYAFGDATPNGWTIGEAVKFDKVDDNTYTATFAIKAGEMKFPLNNDWGCDWIMPTENGVGLSHSACMLVKNGDSRDYKWKVSEEEAGTYTIVLDVKNMTMTATKSE
ncbi:fimbrillin family protein [Leyella stercorea]|uniref:fimbrillin family protein n=1 Tax=Leyella stercorea TaxID=363265 RepID=UPI001E096893|nr:SusF/SusE family outer membrane protein [Leyella stercorea]